MRNVVGLLVAVAVVSVAPLAGSQGRTAFAVTWTLNMQTSPFPTWTTVPLTRAGGPIAGLGLRRCFQRPVTSTRTERGFLFEIVEVECESSLGEKVSFSTMCNLLGRDGGYAKMTVKGSLDSTAFVLACDSAATP